MADRFMYIPSVNTQNYPFCTLQLLKKRLDTQLNIKNVTSGKNNFT